MKPKYYITMEERADSYYYPEITRCWHCKHPVEEIYNDVYRHISDEIAGKKCRCGCDMPLPTSKKSTLNPVGNSTIENNK